MSPVKTDSSRTRGGFTAIMGIWLAAMYFLVMVHVVPLRQTPLQPDTAACKAWAEEIWRTGRAYYAFDRDQVSVDRYLTFSIPKPLIMAIALAVRPLSDSSAALRVVFQAALIAMVYLLAHGWRQRASLSAILFVVPAATFREHLLWATISQASTFYTLAVVLAVYCFAHASRKASVWAYAGGSALLCAGLTRPSVWPFAAMTSFWFLVTRRVQARPAVMGPQSGSSPPYCGC